MGLLSFGWSFRIGDDLRRVNFLNHNFQLSLVHSSLFSKLRYTISSASLGRPSRTMARFSFRSITMLNSVAQSLMPSSDRLMLQGNPLSSSNNLLYQNPPNSVLETYLQVALLDLEFLRHVPTNPQASQVHPLLGASDLNDILALGSPLASWRMCSR